MNKPLVQKILIIPVLFFVFINMSGCVMLLAGAAGAAGTASWLSGKLTQEVDKPLPQCIKATKSALKSLRLTVTKETIKEDVAQILCKYTDDRTVWIDLHKMSEKITRIEVRVGAKGDKEAAREILNKIMRYL